VQRVGIKAIFLARVLILARLLAPDDFGLFAICTVATAFLTRVTDLGMVSALVQRGSPEDAHYDAAWTIGLLRGVAIALVIGLGAPVIAGLFAEPRAVDLLRVLALRPVVDSLGSVRVAGLIRDLRFRSVAAVQLTGALANATVSIGLAFPLGVWALIIGPLVGSAAQTVASYIVAPYRPRVSLDHRMARPLIDYGRWIMMSGWIAVAGDSLLQMVISRRLGAASLGIYYMAAQLAFLPWEVSGEVVGFVAFPVYARLKDNALKASRAFRAILKAMSAVVFPATAILIAIAPSIVMYVLGSGWEGTVPVIRVLALASVLGIMWDAIAPALKGFGQPKKVAVVELVQLVIIAVVVWQLTGWLGVTGAALASLIALLVAQCLGILYVHRILDRPFAHLGVPLLATTLVASGAGLTAWVVAAHTPGVVGVVIAGGLGLVVAALSGWFLDYRLRLGIRTDLAEAFPQATEALRGLIGRARRGPSNGPSAPSS
jgi:O-antigen/teichoic acid export membrane protein